MQAPNTSSISTILPYNGGTLTYTATAEETVTLSDEDDITSLTSRISAANFNGKNYQTIFDRTTLMYSTTTPEGRSSTSKINEIGRLLESQITGLEKTVYAYNTNGRLTSILQSAGSENLQVNYGYNSSGYLNVITNNLGHSFSFEYDLAGRITRQLLPGSREINYQYDNNSNLTSLSPPGKPAHTFTYNNVDALLSSTPPDTGTGLMPTHYTYNSDRQISQINLPDGQTLNYTYDTAGKLKTVNSHASGELKRFTYDATTGQLATISNTDGVGLEYTYNGGLITANSLTGEVTGTIDYQYNNDLQITQVDVSESAEPILYGYDNDGLVTGVGYAQPGSMMTISRDPNNGMITTTQFGNMISDSRQYNAFGAIENYEVACNSISCFNITYTYDAVGRIIEKIETIEGGEASTYRYTYDDAGQLFEVRDGSDTLLASYTYDANGNRLTGPGLTINAIYDTQDRLLSYGDTTYSYTHTGYLQNKNNASGTTTYAYDVFGNLKSLTLSDGRTINYLVDGYNRRIAKKVDDTMVKGFLYGGGISPIAELDGNNSLLTLFFYTGGSHVPNLMLKGGVPYRIITDHLNSPRLVVNAHTGIIAQRLDYDQFGNIISDTHPGFQPFVFAGGLYDQDTGLIRFGARDYIPEIGRWTGKDPVGFSSGSANLYAYVDNQPLTRTDPSGLGWQGYLSLSWDTSGQIGLSSFDADPVGVYWGADANGNLIEAIYSSYGSSPVGMSIGGDVGTGCTITWSPFGNIDNFNGDAVTYTMGLELILGHDITISVPKTGETREQAYSRKVSYNHYETEYKDVAVVDWSGFSISVSPNVALGGHVTLMATGEAHTTVSSQAPFFSGVTPLNNSEHYNLVPLPE
jgi:RHS repeat-associated protein